jgi:ATP-dependent helicase HepA
MVLCGRALPRCGRDAVAVEVALRDAGGSVEEGESVLCPNCGTPMQLRFSRRGDPFWGCPRFPNCRGSRDYNVGSPVRPGRARGEGAARSPRSPTAARRRTSIRPGDLLFATDNSLGPGKALKPGAQDSIILEYFDHPGQSAEERHREDVPRTALKRYELVPEARVFWEAAGQVPAWRSGRVRSVAPDEQVEVSGYGDDHGFHDHADLYVRWDRPLRDPTGLARVGLFESPYNFGLRTPVLRSVLAQRAASRGMPGLLNVTAELHAHQLAAAKRVLTDHVQRYLIADEVGLGKTIEALLILRQLMLDEPFLSATVIVPRHLVGQWQSELRAKLHPEHFPEAVIEVVPHDEVETWMDADILVIDEAHQLVGGGAGDERFERLRELAAASPRLLLISATPALHNERAFLGMLHLLDPDVYALEDVDGLRSRLESRQELGRTLLALTPETPEFLLPGTLDRLRAQLAGHRELEVLVDAVGRAGAGDRRAAIGELRQQLADTFQVHRRMIRTRRTEQLTTTFPLAGRSGATHVAGLDEAWSEVADAFERAREALAIATERGDMSRDEAVRLLAATATNVPDIVAMGTILEDSPAAGSCKAEHGDLLFAIADALTYEVRGDESAVIFAPTASTAQRLATALEELLGASSVETLLDGLPPADARSRVEAHERRRVQWLVCDQSAAEGTNLQHADVLVHVGLPGLVNELEQRIGRLDRWSAGRERPWRALVVSPDSGAIARWAEVVDRGFAVHDRSLAAMQRAVEEWSLEVWGRLLDPTVATRILVTDVQAALASEAEAVREQDAIDAVVLGGDDREFTETLIRADREADAAFGSDFQNLLTDAPGNLRFKRQSSPATGAGTFEADDPRTRRGEAPLVPLGRLRRSIVPALVHPWAGRRQKAAEPGAGLLRLGSPLVDAITDFLWHDDRGRAWGMWRYDSAHERAPEVWVRVDVHVHADPTPIVEVLDVDPYVVRRRLDGAFPPLLATTWWSPGNADGPSDKLASILAAPYRKPESRDAASGDFHLSRTRLDAFLAVLDGPLETVVDEAVDAVDERTLARAEVEQAVATASEMLRARQSARTAALRRRLRAQPPDEAIIQEELEFEEFALPLLLQQVEHPTTAIDALGFVVVSGENPFHAEQDEP